MRQTRPVITGDFEFIGITAKTEAIGNLFVRFRCGEREHSLEANPAWLESFITFRSRVLGLLGLWLTIADPDTADWQQLVAAACVAGQAEAEAAT